ncbi:MAG: electron transfer flavoprotein subunit alpha/FixB family protein [Synergistaceae bacterium]|jgi:electron transfer flavoprotein alpha subunit|nr:electron transfer flavoprotein subunit alpha/FixB family protein [Synergistaceae bacterium]
MNKGLNKGICVFADNRGGRLEPVFLELLAAARRLSEVMEEPVQALLAADGCEPIIEELQSMDVDEIYAVETPGISDLADDSRSAVLADALSRIAPSCVIIPANDAGRSIFPRVAIKLNTGLTADCTDLVAERKDGGGYFIKQNKPSFGDNVMVSIVNRNGSIPQMMTIREGVCKKHDRAPRAKPVVQVFGDIKAPPSSVSLLEFLPRREDSGMLAADLVVAAGKGAAKNDGLDVLSELAKKLGGVLGGTRPLAEEGLIPFENQIGQTGRTVRPSVCLSFGASGAIQHTEGIKDAKLFVAVNEDRNAPIFNFADYGVVADAKETAESLLKKIN